MADLAGLRRYRRTENTSFYVAGLAALATLLITGNIRYVFLPIALAMIPLVLVKFAQEQVRQSWLYGIAAALIGIMGVIMVVVFPD